MGIFSTFLSCTSMRITNIYTYRYVAIYIYLEISNDLTDSLETTHIKAIPECPGHFSILFGGSGDGLREAKEGEGEIGKAVAERIKRLLLHNLIELKHDQTRDQRSCGGDGRDNFAGDQLGLVTVSGLDIIGRCSQI